MEAHPDRLLLPVHFVQAQRAADAVRDGHDGGRVQALGEAEQDGGSH